MEKTRACGWKYAWVAVLLANVSLAADDSPRFAVEQQTMSFYNDDLLLSGTLYLPAHDAPAPLLILFHAASGGETSFPFYEHLKTSFPESGVATFLYNRRGSGNQPGDFDDASFVDLANDGISAAHALAPHPRIDDRLIGAWGVSQGGWVAPLAATMSKEISFAIAVSGPGVSPAQQMAYAAQFNLREAGYSDDVVAIALALRSQVDNYFRDPGRSKRNRLQMTIDNYRDEPWFPLAFLPNRGALPADVSKSKWRKEMDFDPTKNLSRMTEELLVVFGDQGRWVPIQESVGAISESLPNVASLTVYRSKNSGHLLSGGEESMDYDGHLPVEQAYLDIAIDWIFSLVDR